MMPSTRGSLRLFRALGVDVYLHWLWFVVAFIFVTHTREKEYQVASWKVVEYLALFAIVLLHEYGHCLACRQVGGEADTIVLWPLGGVAYVMPPQRPLAVLWSVAAGPLVNVVLMIPLAGSYFYLREEAPTPDALMCLEHVTQMNLGMLILNLLPMYPLDGGQILWSLLWLVAGRWRGLMVASGLGVLFGGMMVLFSCLMLPLVGGESVLLMFVAVFITMHSLVAFQGARHAQTMLDLPRHTDCACPQCQMAPPQGMFWVCDHCATRFDLFGQRGKCPSCGAWYLQPDCPHCRETSPLDNWFAPPGTGQRMPPSTAENQGTP